MGQGYGFLVLTREQLCGAITVGWAALDRTAHNDITLGNYMNDNARWRVVFESYAETRGKRCMESLRKIKYRLPPKGGAIETGRVLNSVFGRRDHKGGCTMSY